MVTGFQESNLTGPKTVRSRQELSRILTAAVISSQFRQMLLANPTKAVAAGFGGESFTLQGEEKKRLASIHAKSLADFASQVFSIEST
jgi:dihydrodipicolinate synthase/N-acetylneuraminate lyase